MSTNVKLLLLLVMVAGDLLALVITVPKLIRKGQIIVVPIMAFAMLLSVVIFAWVLFTQF